MGAAELSATSLLMEVDDFDFDLGKGDASRAFVDRINGSVGVDPRARHCSTLAKDASSLSPHASSIRISCCHFRLRQMSGIASGRGERA
jgi:hypothetical protein